MSTVSQINGLPIPDDDSPNDPPIHFQAFSDVIDSRLLARFTSTTERDAKISSPTQGMSCWTDDAGFWDCLNSGTWTARVSKSYVDGTTGNLPLIGGWAAMAGYNTPSWTLSNTGWVTLSGAAQRTAASFALGTDTLFQFATLPASCIPDTAVSPISWALLSTGTNPVRVHCAANSAALSVVGMASGTGTMTQNSGFVLLDGVRFHI